MAMSLGELNTFPLKPAASRTAWASDSWRTSALSLWLASTSLPAASTARPLLPLSSIAVPSLPSAASLRTREGKPLAKLKSEK